MAIHRYQQAARGHRVQQQRHMAVGQRIIRNRQHLLIERIARCLNAKAVVDLPHIVGSRARLVDIRVGKDIQ